MASHTIDETSKQQEPQRIGQTDDKLEIEHKDLAAERRKTKLPLYVLTENNCRGWEHKNSCRVVHFLPKKWSDECRAPLRRFFLNANVATN